MKERQEFTEAWDQFVNEIYKIFLPMTTWIVEKINARFF